MRKIILMLITLLLVSCVSSEINENDVKCSPWRIRDCYTLFDTGW